MILFSHAAHPLIFIISSIIFPLNLKDLGDLHYFLEVQVVQTPNLLFLSHAKYTQDLLNCFNLTIHKPVLTPLASRTMLSLMDRALLLDPIDYRSMVGPNST